jgi:hypothetical protein
MCMPNKQKMQNYDYFNILYLKDRSDRDRCFFGSRSGKILERDHDPIANFNTTKFKLKPKALHL